MFPAQPAPLAQLATLAQQAMARLAADNEVATGSSTTTISRPSAHRRRSQSVRFLLAALFTLLVGAAVWTASRLRSAGDEAPIPAGAAASERAPAGGVPAAALPPLAAGEVLFAVVPFGELVALRDSAGRDLLGEAAVPLPARLRLPSGAWTAVVRFPVSGEVAELPLRVGAGETVRLDHRFTRLEARAYLEATGW